MTVSNPKEVPEYELNPLELEFRRGEEVTKARSTSPVFFPVICLFICLVFINFHLSAKAYDT